MTKKPPPLVFNLGPVDKIPPGQGTCFIVCGEEIAVFRQRDGRMFATQNRCPHRQGPLSEGLAGDGKVICPLHSHKFDLASGKGENHECLRTFPVSDQDGDIVLSFSGSTTVSCEKNASA